MDFLTHIVMGFPLFIFGFCFGCYFRGYWESERARLIRDGKLRAALRGW